MRRHWVYADSPRYLLRKFCALRMIRSLPRGRVLEIGCGGGSFSGELLTRGFDVEAVDSSPEAVELCRKRLSEHLAGPGLKVELKDFHEVTGRFLAVFMFEVLEHIEFDRQALSHIHGLVEDDGYLIISVPANKAWFGPSDRFVGHYRRYDREDIVDLVSSEGFRVEAVWSYGVPLANLTEWIRNRLYRGREVVSKTTGTRQSGTLRNIEYRFRFLLNDLFLLPFYLFQMLFIHGNLGTGLIIRAKKES